MNNTFIRDIIEAGEGENVELKSSFTKEVIETIVAFSNTKGGKIILGCNDKKKIAGITIAEESLQKWVNEVKQNTEPSIFPTFEIYEIENKSVVLITVDEFPLKPIQEIRKKCPLISLIYTDKKKMSTDCTDLHR